MVTTRRKIFENGGQWLEVDETSGELVWDGKTVQTKQTVSLEGWTLALAAVATAATVVSAIWPIALRLHWFGL